MNPLESARRIGLAAPASREPEAELSAAQVADLVSLLEKGFRARRLYETNNPVYRGFVATLRGALAAAWQRESSIQFGVEETGFRWRAKSVGSSDGRDTLAFIFWRDGIRYFTLLPGFEEEVESFLDVVHSVRYREQFGDDLVTLFWEQQFTGFQYSYVDVLADAVELPESDADSSVRQVDAATVVADAAGAIPEPLRPSVQAALALRGQEETLYFLDATELDRLEREVSLEWERDVRLDVLNGLFDRLEEPIPARQREILSILHQLLPNYLAVGDLRSASVVVGEIQTLAGTPGVLDPRAAGDARQLLEELSSPAMVRQLVQALESAVLDPSGADVELFLRQLGPAALPELVLAAATTEGEALRQRLFGAVDAIARDHPDDAMALLDAEDLVVAAAAARLLGRIGEAQAAVVIARLLARPEAALRLAAAEALAALHTPSALEALLPCLEDPDREVRVVVARAFARLRYPGARARLEQIVRGKAMHGADLTEKLAVFEAYGAVANAEGAALLDRLLNGKSLFLRRRKPPEVRACAAVALGRVATPPARASLERARKEPNPLVRNAVSRALRQESVSA